MEKTDRLQKKKKKRKGNFVFLRTKNRVIYVFTISYKLERFFFERPDHFEHFLVMNTIIQGITAIGVNLT